MTALGAMFRPRSIAIIGASDDPLSLSGRPLAVLRQHAYDGEIYLVNPNREQIGGLPCYPAIGAVPQAVDLVIVAVRAALVPGVIADCAAAGTRAVVIFSSGFAEQDEAGRAAQGKLAQIARDTGIRLLGPNGEGFLNVPRRGARLVQPDRGLQPGPDPPGARRPGRGLAERRARLRPVQLGAGGRPRAPASWSPPGTRATSTRWRSPTS